MDAKKSIKILIAFVILLIIGVLITIFNGFKLDLNYDNSTRIEIAINKQLNINEVAPLVTEVYSEEQLIIETVGAFKDTIGITVSEVSEEKNEQVIKKLNEKYGTELEVKDITMYEIPGNNIYDIAKPYIGPTIISLITILVIVCYVYRKYGIIKKLLEMLVLIISAEILYIIFISIFNIKITSTILIGAVAIMIYVIICLLKAYEKLNTVK